MARIAYDDRDAAAFAATRHLQAAGLTEWRTAVARHVPPHGTLLDVGAGTGMWSGLFASWFPTLRIVAVEPSASMRARSGFSPMIAGDALALPLQARSVDAIWLSTVIHHIPDLAGLARSLRRVLRPGGKVLIRSAFAGRHHGISLFRWWPEAIRVLDTFPGVADVQEAFAGFHAEPVEAVPQLSAPSLRAAADGFRREAHTPLQLIADGEYAAGLARLRAAARTDPGGPLIDHLDLLVLHLTDL
ncbi:methyltransferase domain-containing protein [Actinoplanes sp. NPDC051475]|uniref:class I SAM-dependent methyltransferase n=1 Tax=Actinoplanes sp. NPDC051475 TaxID=3157225 RepID=UPI00344F6184